MRVADFDSGLIPRRDLIDLYPEAPILEVPEIHAEQHFGPILSIHAACSGVHADDGRVIVVLTEIERFGFKPGKLPLDARQFVPDLILGSQVVLFSCQFEQYRGVVESIGSLLRLVDHLLIAGQLPVDLCSPLGIIPELRLARFLAQSG